MRRSLNAAPPADTRRVPPSSLFAPRGAMVDSGGLCLHVLSSFQRTGLPDEVGHSLCGQPSSGEPSYITRTFRGCQPSQPRQHQEPVPGQKDGGSRRRSEEVFRQKMLRTFLEHLPARRTGSRFELSDYTVRERACQPRRRATRNAFSEYTRPTHNAQARQFHRTCVTLSRSPFRYLARSRTS